MEPSRELKLLIKAEELMEKGAKYGLIENGLTYEQIKKGEEGRLDLSHYLSQLNSNYVNSEQQILIKKARKQFDRDNMNILYWSRLPQNKELEDLKVKEDYALLRAMASAGAGAAAAERGAPNLLEKFHYGRFPGGSRKNVIQPGKRHRSHRKNRTKKHKSRK